MDGGGLVLLIAGGLLVASGLVLLLRGMASSLVASVALRALIGIVVAVPMAFFMAWLSENVPILVPLLMAVSLALIGYSIWKALWAPNRLKAFAILAASLLVGVVIGFALNAVIPGPDAVEVTGGG